MVYNDTSVKEKKPDYFFYNLLNFPIDFFIKMGYNIIVRFVRLNINAKKILWIVLKINMNSHFIHYIHQFKCFYFIKPYKKSKTLLTLE